MSGNIAFGGWNQPTPNLAIGTHPYPGNDWESFNGAIDDVRILDIELSEIQIQESSVRDRSLRNDMSRARYY